MSYDTKQRRLLAAALVAGATSAVLFAGAGTGHAGPVPKPDFNSNGTIGVKYTMNVMGLNASIQDLKNPPGVTEHCHYHSMGTGLTAPIPFDSDVFPNGTEFATLFIPTISLGGTWHVTINCDHGGVFDYDVTY